MSLFDKLLIVGGFALLAAGFIVVSADNNKHNNTPIYSERETAVPMEMIVARTLGAVVAVEGSAGNGSGVAIGARTVVTNAHVVTNDLLVKVTLRSGASFYAPVVWRDAEKDLALIDLPELARVKYVELRCNIPVLIGEEVFALGHPYGLRWTATFGRVSGLNREMFSTKDAIQLDVTVGPGNSGGGLFDTDGKLVGIVFAGIYRGFAGQNLAIPVATLCSVLNRFNG